MKVRKECRKYGLKTDRKRSNNKGRLTRSHKTLMNTVQQKVINNVKFKGKIVREISSKIERQIEGSRFS